MYEIVQNDVFPFIKNLHDDKDSAYSKYMDDAIFKLPTPLMLDKAVNAMDDIYALMDQMHESDTKGDVYEYLLGKLQQSGVNGQFRTPRHIIHMMVELMQPTPEEVICDWRHKSICDYTTPTGATSTIYRLRRTDRQIKIDNPAIIG